MFLLKKKIRIFLSSLSKYIFKIINELKKILNKNKKYAI